MGRNGKNPGLRWIGLGAAAVALLASGIALAYVIARPRVDVTSAVHGTVVEAFYATGTISPQREYSIRGTTGGIVQLKVDKGDHVAAGQIVAVVENADLVSALDQATSEAKRRQLFADDEHSPVLAELRAKFKATGDMLEIAQSEEKRVTGLRDRGATSQSDLETAQNRVKQTWMDTESLKSQIESKKIDLQHDAEVAQAMLKAAQWNLDQASLRSPVAGVVLDRPVSSGTRVAINDHILQVADVSFDHLVMRAQVDEEDKNKLRPPTASDRQEVRMTLYAYPDEILSGTVDRIYDKADPDRRTYEIDIQMDKPDARLAAGMTGELNVIVAKRDDALVVPSQAVQNGGIMVVRDGRVQKPEVVVGLKSLERTEIRSGLQDGDQIVISPIASLSPDQRVRTHFIDPLAAASLNKAATVDTGAKSLVGK